MKTVTKSFVCGNNNATPGIAWCFPGDENCNNYCNHDHSKPMSDGQDAEIEAKERFRAAYGMNDRKLKTYVMHNEALQQERLQYYRDRGLPDEISS